MARKWIKGAIKNPGALTAQARRAGMSTAKFAAKVRANPSRYSAATRRRANLARTLAKMRRRRRRR